MHQMDAEEWGALAVTKMLVKGCAEKGPWRSGNAEGNRSGHVLDKTDPRSEAKQEQNRQAHGWGDVGRAGELSSVHHSTDGMQRALISCRV